MLSNYSGSSWFWILLKMTCSSTAFIHALRVPPNMNSAHEAIRWVNWGVAPEAFGVQT
ncbi:MAG: hypothetical protein HWQ36_03640 [Nostoc sp. NMS2]|uniref:hypothetical protein n=1 Tax=Nostoc sp. NMS2 TaxID=2815389 RepID=UPI0025D576EE|nr:hypothetical protein [Nostoc sp. NMS2]MBN3989652.1 hypothetical protein [Nostoc sp. NMS2]